MKQSSTRSIPTTNQQDLFQTPSNQSASKSISVYRVCLVKDATVSFGQSCVSNSHQAHALIQNLILTRGQPDREQFVGASIMDGNNVPIGSIQRILGHENRSTTEIYLHSIGEAERSAIAVLEKVQQKSHTDSHTETK